MCSLFYNYAEANSKEFCEEISFPSFLRNMLMRGYPHFSLQISIALAKIYFFCVAQKPLYLVDTALSLSLIHLPQAQ